VYDISKQLARKSGGAAEQDVMAELRDAFSRGEAGYIINGTGSSQPYGLTTALTNSSAQFTSTFTAAATLAGSVTSALATAAGALAARNVDNVSAMMNAADYWLMLRQGADDAGYYFNTVGSSAIPGVPTGTLVSPFRIPIYPDTILASPQLIVGDFKSLKLWLGDSFRIDTSDVAGTRWDYNLIGFHSEPGHTATYCH
jgi:HK97 family phage major capsid protein